MPHVTLSELRALRTKLLEAHQALIVDAAEAGVLPAERSISKIADLEIALAAVETLIDVFEFEG